MSIYAQAMAQAPGERPSGRERQHAELERLTADSRPATAGELIEQLGRGWRAPSPRARPRVLLNMIATVDGRASMGGRSGPLSGAADRELFHGLRSAADAVLVGAGTASAEHYGRMIKSAEQREARRACGLSEEPLACIVSGRMALDPDTPLLAQQDARVVVLTAASASLPATAAEVEYVRAERGGMLDLAACLRELRERFGVEVLLCEGGPHLATSLFAEGLVDELFLSVSPQLAGGDPAAGEAPRILAGSELQAPVALELADVMRSGSALFLHYCAAA